MDNPTSETEPYPGAGADRLTVLDTFWELVRARAGARGLSVADGIDERLVGVINEGLYEVAATLATRSGRRATERLALALAGETTEIQGRELVLDGKTWLITTEAAVAEWLSWHIHCEDPNVPTEDADGNPQVACLCGVGFSGSTWDEADKAMDGHRAEQRAEYVRAARGRPAPAGTPQ